MVPNLATPTPAFSLIFTHLNSNFGCLLVLVSGNMNKRRQLLSYGRRAACRNGFFSLLVNRCCSSKYICSRYTCMPAFQFHSFLLNFVNLRQISTLSGPIWCMLWLMWFVADIVVSLIETQSWKWVRSNAKRFR